jgi:hypothetical protein
VCVEISELVWLAGKAGPNYVSVFNKHGSVFRIADFDQRAAIELAMMNAADKGKTGGIRAGSTASMAKVKFDRQIVAIAKVNKVATIYSDDEDLRTFAEANNIEVVRLLEMPLPPSDSQPDLFKEGANETQTSP